MKACIWNMTAHYMFEAAVLERFLLILSTGYQTVPDTPLIKMLKISAPVLHRVGIWYIIAKRTFLEADDNMRTYVVRVSPPPHLC